jgi:hypothetical protein
MAWMFALRYLGPPHARRFVIQRNDHRFWSGSDWVDHHGDARLYRSVLDAQEDYHVLKQPLVKGKPSRRFTCTFTVTVAGDDLGKITARDVREYLRSVMHVGLDYEAVSDDSPLAEAHVDCHVKLPALREAKRPS